MPHIYYPAISPFSGLHVCILLHYGIISLIALFIIINYEPQKALVVEARAVSTSGSSLTH